MEKCIPNGHKIHTSKCPKIPNGYKIYKKVSLQGLKIYQNWNFGYAKIPSCYPV
jgi:hypothetical protein